MNRSVTVATLLTALATASLPAMVGIAAAQSTSRLERAKAALSPAAAQALDRAVTAARDRGLPTDPLVDKALEGVAKGIPAERVVAVVQQLADQLGRAQALLGRAAAATPADVAAVADALRRGVPDAAVRDLRADAKAGEPVALAIHTLADLLDRGVPVDIAVDVIGAWRGRGAKPDELREIPAAVERLIREGALPAQAGAAVASAVRNGRGSGGATMPPKAGSPRVKPRRGPPDHPPIPPGAGPPDGRGGKSGQKKPGSGSSN